MKITQEKLNQVITSHGKWLRREDGGERANLRKANLQGVDLHEADLRDTDLRGANLRRANLQEANLNEADLRDTDLRGADLRGADLQDANLRRANLQDTDLRGADLQDTYLQGAYLQGADLDQTYYQITRIGSRNATTTYCIEKNNVVCGCWNHYRGGTLADFKERVKNIYDNYGEMPNKRYYRQYMAAIEFFEKMAELGKE